MDTKEIEGKIFIASKDASKKAKLNQDYIGQLCRQEKLIAKRFGRRWYVCEESLDKYIKTGDGSLEVNPVEVKDFVEVKSNSKEPASSHFSKLKSVTKKTSKQSQKKYDFSIPQIISSEHRGAFVLGVLVIIITLFVSSTGDLSPNPVATSLVFEAKGGVQEVGSYFSQAFGPVAYAIRGVDQELGFSNSVYVRRVKNILISLSVGAKKIYDPAPIKSLALESAKNFSRFYIEPVKKVATKVYGFSENVFGESLKGFALKWENILRDATITPARAFANNNPELVREIKESQMANASVALVSGAGTLAFEFWKNAEETFAWMYGTVRSVVVKTKIALSDVPKFSESRDMASTDVPKVFESKNEKLILEDEEVSSSAGLVVTGIPEGSTADEEIEKIKKNFSDEVIITKDESGGAGVITPVFKERTGDDYVYVMIPLQEEYEN